VAAPARQVLISQQRPNKMAGAKLCQALLYRRKQPSLLGQFDDVGRQARCTRASGAHLVQTGVEVAAKPPLISVEVSQDKRKVGTIAVHQLKQPMLYLYIIVTARHRQPGR